MSVSELVLAELQPLLLTCLRRLGATVTARVPGIHWYVGVAKSQNYPVVVHLSFFASEDCETELVVVTVLLRSLASDIWDIDMIDRESAFIGDTWDLEGYSGSRRDSPKFSTGA